MWIALLMWAILGGFTIFSLCDQGDFFGNMSFKTMTVVCLICGPCGWAWYILSLCVALVKFIVILLEE